MKEPPEFSLSAVNQKRGAPHAASTPGRPEGSSGSGAPHRAGGVPGTPNESPAGDGLLEKLPFDPLRLLAAVVRGWWKILAGGLALGLLGGLLGWFKFDTYYTATVQIIRRELPNSFRASDLGESFKPRQFSAGTVTAMMRSPSLLTQVGRQATPPVSGRMLAASLQITPERNTDLITISLKGASGARETADLLNLYAQQVVDLTKGLQAQEAVELNEFLRAQLAKTESELATASQELLSFSRGASFFSSEKEVEAYLRALNEAELRIQTARLERGALDFQIAAVTRELAQQDPRKLKLAQAQEQLADLLVRYTDFNPQVMEQQAAVDAMMRQLDTPTNNLSEYQAGPNAVANSLYLDLVTYEAQREAFDAQFPQLEAYRTNLLSKLEGIPEKSLRYAELNARHTSLEITRDLLAARQREAQVFADDSPGYYRLFAPVAPEQVARSNRSQKVSAVSIVGFLFGGGAVLLLLAFVEILDDRIVTASDLRRAVQSPVLIQLGELDQMTGSEQARWRFRTWSILQKELRLTDAGSLVVGFLSARSGEGRSECVQLLQAAAAEREWRTLSVVNRVEPESRRPALSIRDALEQPQRVVEAFATGNHITVLWDDSWEWNMAQRAQWHAALRLWETLPRVALLVELPPAEKLESVMLAETLPQVFWVCQSEATNKTELTSLMGTLRVAQVNVHGAFLNRVTSPLRGLSFLGRLGLVVALGLIGYCTPASAQTNEAPLLAGNTNMVLSATAAGPQLAPWQEHLTLGPGDVVNLSIYGKKQFTRIEVPIGPDGRISYLQASDVMAAGLTIEELRDTLTEELGRYYRNARVIVTPSAWRSKKYYLLGTIMDRGTYYLDQPMTIIEATARARGIATGLLQQNTVEIADLPRTFLIRDGQRMPVDFVKLFHEGDLTQNIQLEPGDYIYFPSASLNEVYVLGSVFSPGTVGVTENASVISILTSRGGFTPKAYKQRVLVVRGSLNQPVTHVVNVGAILAGKASDFLVQPKDIIYVADRPWARVEELLDMAIKAFVITATAEWVNVNMSPIIVEPIIPGL